MIPVMIEKDVEDAALNILSELGYKILYGPDIAPAPDGIAPERQSYSDVVLIERLKDAVDRFNPNIPEEAREEAVKKVLRSESQQLIVNNQHFHKMLVEGVNVEYRRKDGKEICLKYVTELSKAFALAVPHEDALKIRDEVGFFQAVKSGIVKTTIIPGKPQEELDSAVRQIISKAIASDKVIDIFAAAGLKKPDISILSDEFLAEVKELPHKNLAFELSRKPLSGQFRA